MNTHRKPPNPRNWIYTSIVVSVAVFLAIIGFGGGSAASVQAGSVAPVAPTTKAPAAASSPASSVTRAPIAEPKPTPKPAISGPGTSSATLGSLTQRVMLQPDRIQIPALGVDAPVIAAGVTSAGALEVPENVTQAAWYQVGSAPSQPGTAIIAAHVDYAGKLGLFNALHTLPTGSLIEITDSAGRVHQFRTTTGSLAPKSDPSTVEALAAASAAAGKPQLALITCGGDLNSAAHTYYDNYVLLADL